MESYTLRVRRNDKGPLYGNRTIVSPNGPLLCIATDVPHKCHGINPGFNHVAMDKTGYKIAAGDTQGNVYLFDLKRSRYKFVIHLDRCCSSLSFTNVASNDLIVASSDCSVSFIETDTCSVKESFNIHKTCVNNISINDNGKRAITSSLDTALLWNLEDLDISNKMSLKINIEILKVFFLPVRELIITAFKVDSVFLWTSDHQELISEFACSNNEEAPWVKTIDASRDGELICCAGRKDEIVVWSVGNKSFLWAVSFNNFLQNVKLLSFLSQASTTLPYIAGVLNERGKLQFFDMKELEKIETLSIASEGFVTFVEEEGKVVLITKSSTLEVYDLAAMAKNNKPVKNTLIKEKAQQTNSYESCLKKNIIVKKHVRKKSRMAKEKLTKGQLRLILSTNGEYPTKYRQFIWSNLLELPKNDEFIVYYREENIKELDVHDGIFQNPAMKKTFLRIYSMLIEWCPQLSVIEFFPSMIVPFVNAFHRNVQFCFEVLLTYVTSWCQHWFWYSALPPYHILCAIENLLFYHDGVLSHHYVLNDISPQVYGFTLLSTSFSDVFSEEDWLKLYDNVFSEAPSFIIFIVVAYNIACRKVLLKCTTEEQVQVFLSRKSVLVLNILKEARRLFSVTPPVYDPTVLVGDFAPLPSGSYPVFNQFAIQKDDLQVLDRQRIIDDEAEDILNRQEELQSNILLNPSGVSGSERIRLVEESLSQLNEMRQSMKSLILSTAEIKDVNVLKQHEEKIHRVQRIMQRTLQTPVSLISVANKSRGSLVDSISTLKEVLQIRQELTTFDT